MKTLSKATTPATLTDKVKAMAYCAIDAGVIDAVDIVSAIIRKLEETTLQAYQPWIPVSERKPTESELRNGMVLAWSTELSEWQVESWGYVEDRPEDYTHWKPLPEPPKGD